MTHREVAALLEAEQYQQALSALDPLLEADPNDAEALYMLGIVFLQSDKPQLAYQIYKRLTELRPERKQVWLNMGKSADELQLHDEAAECFNRVLDIDSDEVLAYSNLASVAIHRCQPKEAIRYAKRALRMVPNARGAKLNLGFAKLMLKDYSGWEEYEAGLGNVRWRDEKQYGEAPRWDGNGGKTLVVYAEQGIGDQIAMSEAIREAIRDSYRLVLDVDPKLQGMFERNFQVETHGTQHDADPEWARGKHFDAKCAMSSLQKYYRNSVSKYSGRPWLRPCPTRVEGVKGIMRALPHKPKIGISWTGGMKVTGGEHRSTTLEVIEPILRAIDAVWISLEYKDRSDEIKRSAVPIMDFPWMTRTRDYDDTGALVACLDLIISVPQSVVHLAGAMGKPCWVMQTDRPHFLFGLEGETPLYSSVRQFRRNGDDWGSMVADITRRLKKWAK